MQRASRSNVDYCGWMSSRVPTHGAGPIRSVSSRTTRGPGLQTRGRRRGRTGHVLGYGHDCARVALEAHARGCVRARTQRVGPLPRRGRGTRVRADCAIAAAANATRAPVAGHVREATATDAHGCPST